MSVDQGRKLGVVERKGYDLELEYPRNFQTALGGSLVLFILIFLFVRNLTVEAYTQRGDVETLLEQLPEQLEDITEPPPPPKPQIPVEIEEAEADEEVEEIEFQTTTEFDEVEPPPPQSNEVFEFFAVEVKPELKGFPKPQYPEMARKAGLEGKVVVKALVDENGKVTQTQILQSTNDIFNSAAISAAKRASFSPGRQQDRAVKVWVAIPFNFTLK